MKLKNMTRSIVPVIDLLQNQVVHATAGDRANYRPFRRTRFRFQEPAELVSQLVNEFQPRYLYLADLDAIDSAGNPWGFDGEPVNFRSLKAILAELETTGSGTSILLDAGFQTAQDSIRLAGELKPADRWIPVYGSETVRSFEQLARELGSEGRRRCFVSVDCRAGSVIRPEQDGFRIANVSPMGFLEQLIRFGFRRTIFLDLDRVGTGGQEGSDTSTTTSRLIQRANECRPDRSIEVFGGGGVHDAQDVCRLLDLGFDGCLVATAIHNGKLVGKEIRQRVPESGTGGNLE